MTTRMDVNRKELGLIRESRVRSNSFECDAIAMDTLLGLKSLSNRNLRLDAPQSSVLPKTENWEGSAMQVHAPIEIIPAERPCNPIAWNAESANKQARLLRLLDQQQSWYDAQQQAASAAEQLLSLCEHHQQQWLTPNQLPPQAPPTHPMEFAIRHP